jgi:hypothetical protein
MKERPLILYPWEITPTLDGRKTVFRRPMNPQPTRIGADGRRVYADADFKKSWRVGMDDDNPYGQPGDRLWVRETHAYVLEDGGAFDANEKGLDTGDGDTDRFNVHYRVDGGEVDWDGGWRPSILMHRWASRLTLEVTGVRVERVQEIEREEVAREGVGSTHWQDEEYWVQRRRFEDLWNALNAKRGFGWDKNPLVWVVEFRRVTA